MKEFIKKSLEKIGLRINFTKNLWYLDSFKLIKRLTSKANPIIFDIGACDGHSAVLFKKLFPISRIYSFEPYPESFELLKKTSARMTGISAHEYALSNYNGEMDFFVNKSKATNSLFRAKFTNSFIDDHIIYERKISVKTITLDSFIKQNEVNEIDILKIDIQGGELLAFKGSETFLKEGKVKLIYTEIWFIEGYIGQPLYHDIASYLAKFNYLPFGVYNLHFRKDGHFLWGDAIFLLADT